MAEKKLDFEQAVNRLNEIIRALERGDTPLEDSIKLFEEGAKLAGLLQKTLAAAEQKLTVMQLEVEADD